MTHQNTQSYVDRLEADFYNPSSDVYSTRSLDVAAYIELKLSQSPEASLVKGNNGNKVQFNFRNSLQIRDLLELYDRGEALVEPKQYSSIKIRLIQTKNALMPRAK